MKLDELFQLLNKKKADGEIFHWEVEQEPRNDLVLIRIEKPIDEDTVESHLVSVRVLNRGQSDETVKLIGKNPLKVKPPSKPTLPNCTCLSLSLCAISPVWVRYFSIVGV